MRGKEPPDRGSRHRKPRRTASEKRRYESETSELEELTESLPPNLREGVLNFIAAALKAWRHPGS
jgi:hypothetical protein